MTTDNTNEEWRDVVGYKGLYQVSSLGNVRSLPREVKGKVNIVQNLKGRVLKQGEIKSSAGTYLAVSLSKNGNSKTFRVHKLVCTAFHGAMAHNHHVDHIDDDKHNNRADNLEWLTARKNVSKAHRQVSGLPTGVRAIGKKFIARLKVYGKEYRTSVMLTAEEAEDAYGKMVDIVEEVEAESRKLAHTKMVEFKRNLEFAKTDG